MHCLIYFISLLIKVHKCHITIHVCLIFSAGGHGLVPVSWKRYWCVIKNGQLYCFKTSFDAAADYCFPLKCYELEVAVEKRKNRFVVCVYRLQPPQIYSKHCLGAWMEFAYNQIRY